MMSSLFIHPALPIFLGSFLILYFKRNSNLISIVALLISLITLLFFIQDQSLVYTYYDFNLHYFSYNKLAFLFCLVFLVIGIIGKSPDLDLHIFSYLRNFFRWFYNFIYFLGNNGNIIKPCYILISIR